MLFKHPKLVLSNGPSPASMFEAALADAGIMEFLYEYGRPSFLATWSEAFAENDLGNLHKLMVEWFHYDDDWYDAYDDCSSILPGLSKSIK